MLGILRKDCLLFAIAALVVFPAVLLAESLLSKELGAAAVATNTVLMWLLVFVPLIVIELEEEHANGYVLLGSLPVRTREIVAAKFLLFLGATAACTAAQLVFLVVAPAKPALLASAQSVSLLTGAACLLVGGLFYAAIFSFGCTPLLMAALTTGLCGCFIATILLGQPAAREHLREAAGVVLQLSGRDVVLGGLALYALLFLISAALVRFEPRKKYHPLF